MLSFSITLLGKTSLDDLSHILLWVRWHVRPVFGTGPTNNNCLILLTIDSWMSLPDPVESHYYWMPIYVFWNHLCWTCILIDLGCRLVLSCTCNEVVDVKISALVIPFGNECTSNSANCCITFVATNDAGVQYVSVSSSYTSIAHIPDESFFHKILCSNVCSSLMRICLYVFSRSPVNAYIRKRSNIDRSSCYNTGSIMSVWNAAWSLAWSVEDHF